MSPSPTLRSLFRYLSERGLVDGQGPARFPPAYGPTERDTIYKTFSLDGWAGRSGHDAPMIAYDALLRAGNSWEELCGHAMFHGGESRQTQQGKRGLHSRAGRISSFSVFFLPYFSSGDSDSTGVIAACCWGVAHEFSSVPEGNHMALEYRGRMVAAADQLYDLAWGQRLV